MWFALRRYERIVWIILIITCILTFPNATNAEQSTIAQEDIQNGPHIDQVIYKYVGTNIADQINAFLNDEIDLLVGSVEYQEFGTLDYTPDIDLYTGLRNRYWCFDINCRDSPLKWTALRRAFAYAFDKTGVVTDLYGGLSTPQDSIVPHTSRFCIEGDLEWHYYTSRTDIGNQILNNFGFEIDPITGYRNDPNGNPMHIVIGYAPSSGEIGGGFAQAGVNALNALHISAEKHQEDFNAYISNLYCTCSYDIVVYQASFDSSNLLGSVFWKETTEVLRNDCYFSNSTYDIYFADLLSKPGFYEVYDAAAEIQKIIHFNVPRLVICPTPVIQPYRTDRFMGLIEDLTRGVSGVWSLCNMYSITGNPGGSVRIGFTSMPGSFNIYTAYLNTRPFFENLWPTLFSIGPDMELIPNIATSMSVERHADNQDIPEGHTRLTIDMIQNATWSDGIPLTAEDVVFTHMYELESGAFGNPAAQDLQGILSIYAPTPYRVVIEYSTESFWYPYNEAVRYIIPKRMFSLGGIGYERWEDWNPVRDPDEPHITCGPFIMNEFISTENTMEFTMKKNPNYHYNASDLPDVNTATPSTTDATLPNPTGLQPLILNPFQFVSVTISTSSSVVILGVLIQILRHKRRSVR